MGKQRTKLISTAKKCYVLFRYWPKTHSHLTFKRASICTVQEYFCKGIDFMSLKYVNNLS